jgi:DNA-binding GntR family transcriptional regulator
MAKAVDVAYRAIREGILSGEYPQGAHITAQQLAEASGLSRTPVREAMRRLHAEGLIRFIANRGAFVSSWTDDEIQQVYELRILLESFAAQEAAKRVDPEQLERLRVLAVDMRDLVSQTPVDVKAVARVNDDFQLVLEACGNHRLRDLLGAIVEVPLQLNTFRRYSMEQLKRSAAQHLEMVSAFETADPDWARSIMTAHIRSARHTLMRGIAEDRASPETVFEAPAEEDLAEPAKPRARPAPTDKGASVRKPSTPRVRLIATP